MKDMVPKGTGNSRFLRSSIPENITHEELVALLRAGTFPVDFAGLNIEGIATQGSAYSKANVLPDDVCTALGIATSSEPKDAFLSINRKFDSNYVIGSYVGDGLEDKKEINLGFRPKAVFIAAISNPYVLGKGYSYSINVIRFMHFFNEMPIGNSNSSEEYVITGTGFSIRERQGDENSTLRNGVQLNDYGITYSYMAIR